MTTIKPKLSLWRNEFHKNLKSLSKLFYFFFPSCRTLRHFQYFYWQQAGFLPTLNRRKTKLLSNCFWQLCGLHLFLYYVFHPGTVMFNFWINCMQDYSGFHLGAYMQDLCFDDSIEQKSWVVDKLSGEFTRAHTV